MASNLTKLAKTGAVLTLIGAISLTGVAYVSQAGGINEVIEQLKARALGWKGVAEHNKAEYNKLKAVYDEMLKLLGLQEGATYEQIKNKIDNLVKNADVAGIDNVNDLLYTLATSLGVQDQLVKDANGVYNPQPIYDALEKMEDDLDKAIAKIGDTENGINKEASGDVTYSDDMTLVEKINYLIAQINNANSDQIAIKETADNALAEVTEATDEDKVTSPVEKPKDEASSGSNPGGVQGNAKAEAYAKLSANANAKKLADKGYVVGDVTWDENSGTATMISALREGDNAKYKDCTDFIVWSNASNRYVVQGLTETDVNNLNAWASL